MTETPTPTLGDKIKTLCAKHPMLIYIVLFIAASLVIAIVTKHINGSSP